MVDSTSIKTRSGLTFTADVAGPADGPLVLLLHGFPESRHSWRAALPALAAAGYRAVAPDQRGYSPGARPDPADLSNYAFDKLVDDALEIAAAAGYEGKRFHLVGHDWGGQVSWGVADAHPERLASLTVLSRPHPLSFRRALQKPDGDQKHRSRHHRAFLEPETGRCCSSRQCAPPARGPVRPGRARRPRSRSMSRCWASREAIEAALAWYRSNKGLSGDFGTDQGADALHLGRCRRHGRPRCRQRHRRVRRRAAYAMEVLPGVGHFVMDQAPAKATELMLAHLQEASGLKIPRVVLPLRPNRATTRRL